MLNDSFFMLLLVILLLMLSDRDILQLLMATIERLIWALLSKFYQQFVVSTWESLVSSARVGEMCVPVSSIQDTTVSAQFQLIQEQLRQLQADKSKTETAGSTSTVVDRRSKSPPARRVRFENDYVSYNDDGYTADNRRPTSAYGQSAFRGRGLRDCRMGRIHRDKQSISYIPDKL